MELFDIGLKSVVEMSPDFDESPIEPPAKKILKQKAATKKEWERLLKEVIIVGDNYFLLTAS